MDSPPHYLPGTNTPKTFHDTDRSDDDAIIYVDWDGPNDPNNPLNWSKTRKWIINAIGGAFLTLVGMANSGYAISQPSLEQALHVSDGTASLGVVVFTIAFGMAPLVLAPFSETYGRLPVYISSAVLFWISFLPVPLAKNIGTVLVARFFCGVGGSTSVSIVGGMLADIWQTHERGLPMAIFSYVAFAGTGLGPVAFGYIELALGYKFVNWILFGLSGLMTLLLVVFSKETRSSVLLIRKAKRLRRETGNQNYRTKAEEERSSLRKLIGISLSRPVRLLCREPVLLSYTLWMTYAWGILYLMLQAIPIVFTELYNFNSGENGLMFMGQIIGPTVGLAMNYACDKLYYKNVAKKGPEARLYIAMISGVLLPGGCWMYAWTSTKTISWVVPAIAICVIYAAMFGIYTACFNYITDSYSIYASSAIGGQSAVRLTSGALFTVLAEPLYNRLGIHMAGTLLAALSTVFAVTPFILYYYGATIRAKSPFAKKLAALDELKRSRSKGTDDDRTMSPGSTRKAEVV